MVFFCILKGKEAPEIKNLGGSGAPWRGGGLRERFVENLKFSVFMHFGGPENIDDCQITHLICVRLRRLLYDFFRGCFGPFI